MVASALLEVYMAGEIAMFAMSAPDAVWATVTTNCCKLPVDWRVCGLTLYTPAIVNTSPTVTVVSLVKPSRVMVD